ncbi:MAG: hypothetical protein M3N17_00135 [Actinomycetota bacterium]|nr:hypothetical protein [Actinomycetota bacterium]
MTEVELTEREQRVLEAVTALEAERHAGWLSQIAERVGHSEEETRRVLSRLLGDLDLVQEVREPREDEPDLGPRYRPKTRP